MTGKDSSCHKDVKGLNVLYSVMQSVEGRLGGGEGICGIYGSITQTGTEKIFDCLRHNTGFDGHSVLVDVGAGLGRPLMHALFQPGVRGGFGIELDEVKVTKADAFIVQTIAEMARRGALRPGLEAPVVQCTAIEEVPTLDPASHAYSFWEGVPVEGKAAFGRLFAASRTLKAVAVVQRSMRKEDPSLVMQRLGFGPLLLISTFPVKMSGSGRSFAAYVFSKITPASKLLMARMLSPAPPASASNRVRVEEWSARGVPTPDEEEVARQAPGAAEWQAMTQLEVDEPRTGHALQVALPESAPAVARSDASAALDVYDGGLRTSDGSSGGGTDGSATATAGGTCTGGLAPVRVSADEQPSGQPGTGAAATGPQPATANPSTALGEGSPPKKSRSDEARACVALQQQTIPSVFQVRRRALQEAFEVKASSGKGPAVATTGKVAGAGVEGVKAATDSGGGGVRASARLAARVVRP